MSSEPIPPPDAPNHSVVITAQKADIDELGHVSNLVYVRWVQEVAQAHSTAVGWDSPQYRDAGAVFVVRRHEIDYVAPVFEGEQLELVTWLAWWKLASSERKTAIRRVSDGAVVARATTLWAFVDYASGRPKKIPDAIRTAFGVAALAVALVMVAACGPKDPQTASTQQGQSQDDGEGEGSTGTAMHPDEGKMGQRALSAEEQTLLDEHNKYREAHCAPPLTWSSAVADVAQGWADQLRDSGCAFEHSQTAYGENLAAGSTGYLPPASVVEMWYREVDQYDFSDGAFSMETGHFTQVVWAGSKRVGCGMSTCNGLDVWVCNYDPPGNVMGDYQDNVKPTSCR